MQKAIKDYVLNIWYVNVVTTQANNIWNNIIFIVNLFDFVSFLIVAIVAIHGTYNRQNIIRHIAFNEVNPTVFSAEYSSVLLEAISIPYNTFILDTTTSFAASPDIKATAICQ